MYRILFAIIFSITLTGCGSLKENVGEYITEAVKDKVELEINKKLAERGLSTESLKKVLDTNHDGHIDSKEAISLAKETAKDFALLEAKNLVDSRIKELKESMASKSEVDSKVKEEWNSVLLSLLTLISGYLGKQILSVKNNKDRDNRIDQLERALGRDVDGDGFIGKNGKPVGGGNAEHNPT